MEGTTRKSVSQQRSAAHAAPTPLIHLRRRWSFGGSLGKSKNLWPPNQPARWPPILGRLGSGLSGPQADQGVDALALTHIDAMLAEQSQQDAELLG